jgi:hypothetical protein
MKLSPLEAKPLKERQFQTVQGENPYSWHIAWVALALVAVLLAVLVTVAR